MDILCDNVHRNKKYLLIWKHFQKKLALLSFVLYNEFWKHFQKTRIVIFWQKMRSKRIVFKEKGEIVYGETIIKTRLQNIRRCWQS